MKTFFLSALFLLLAVPWWFTGTEHGPLLFGLPGWALFVIGASFGYACLIAWQLRSEWKALEEDETEEQSG